MVTVAGMALAGCTQTDPGQPVPVDQASPGAASPPTSVSIPPRPKEIKVDGLDPCKVMTKAQLDQIKVDRQRNLVFPQGVLKDLPYCSMDGGEDKVFWTYDLFLMTTQGIAPWFDKSRRVDAKLVSVGGFAAVDYKGIGTTNVDCSTAVDVANGQQMVVSFMPVTRNKFSQEQMCKKSEEAAGLALQALQTPK